MVLYGEGALPILSLVGYAVKLWLNPIQTDPISDIKTPSGGFQKGATSSLNKQYFEAGGLKLKYTNFLSVNPQCSEFQLTTNQVFFLARSFSLHPP